jgi:hypothetical protein
MLPSAVRNVCPTQVRKRQAKYSAQGTTSKVNSVFAQSAARSSGAVGSDYGQREADHPGPEQGSDVVPSLSHDDSAPSYRV